MEASALQHSARLPALAGRSPLLRLQSDEKLIALIRRGHHGAFEALVQRYQPRLLAFCRHMLGSQEDAEDVLQEVFAASFNAICGDNRPINARPWLYRIARNRCLNHLRRAQPTGQDSMDVFEGDGGTTVADTVHKREEFRQIVVDVQELPETQRTALLLREIDALTYEQIAEAMDTTVPSVKSLLVRARVSLAEASEARLLTCDEVRLELGQVAEGIAKSTAPMRRHLKACDRCRTFKGELRKNNKALAAVFPIGPLIFLKKLSITKLGIGAGGAAAASGGAGAAGGAGAIGAAGAAATAGAGFTASSAVSAGISTIASKAAAGMAAAVIVTAGAVEVRHATTAPTTPPAPALVAQAPEVVHTPPAPVAQPKPVVREKPAVRTAKLKEEPKPVKAEPVAAVAPAPVSEPVPVTPPVTPPPVQEDGSTVVVPDPPVAIAPTPPPTTTTPPATTTPVPPPAATTPTTPTTPPAEPVPPAPVETVPTPPAPAPAQPGWGAPEPAPVE